MALDPSTREGVEKEIQEGREEEEEEDGWDFLRRELPPPEARCGESRGPCGETALSWSYSEVHEDRRPPPPCWRGREATPALTAGGSADRRSRWRSIRAASGKAERAFTL